MKIKSILKTILSAKIYVGGVIGWSGIGNSLMIIFLFIGGLNG